MGRILMLALVWTMGAGISQAYSQLHVDSSLVKPATANQLDWHYDRRRKEVSRWSDGKWGLWYINIDRVWACNSFLIFSYKNRNIVYDKEGREVTTGKNEIFCGDSLMILTYKGTSAYVYRHDGSKLVSFFSTYGCWDPKPDTLQCDLVFCLCDWPSSNGMTIGCDALTAWGIMGEDGTWRIPPIFDQPFRFQNGFAEVMHYGTKRKINEKGEFVE